MRFKLPKIKDIQKGILTHPAILTFIEWTRNHSLPGFFKVPIYEVAIFLFNEMRRFDLVTRANSMAFSFFLALFPSIIFLFAVATHFPIYDTFETEINFYIDSLFLDSNAGTWLKETIKSLLEADTGVLSLGFFFAIFFASNGMMAMMRAFDKTHHESSFKNRGGFRKRLISIALTFQIAFLLIASVVLIVLGQVILTWIVDFVRLSQFIVVIIELFRWLVILALLYSGVSIIYRFGASSIKKFKFFTPGATLATLLSILTSIAFSFYASNYGRYNQFYGPIAAIIVLMLWIQINSFILLVGFELNASIAVNRDLKEKIVNEEI